MLRYLTYVKGWTGWTALILIAIAIALAEFLGGIAWVRRILWVFAAVVAATAAVNEWRSRS